jgi:hypothetical protein
MPFDPDVAMHTCTSTKRDQRYVSSSMTRVSREPIRTSSVRVER